MALTFDCIDRGLSEWKALRRGRCEVRRLVQKLKEKKNFVGLYSVFVEVMNSKSYTKK